MMKKVQGTQQKNFVSKLNLTDGKLLYKIYCRSFSKQFGYACLKHSVQVK